jgi:WD40 repeat protein
MEEHPTRRLAAGETVQHYEVIRPLGEGGMGVVYLARDTRLGRRVALKMLTSRPGDPVDRFLLEAQATAQLGHENIVVIHEIGEHHEMPYMVLEHLRGKTFEKLLRDIHAPAPHEAAPDASPKPRAAMGLPPGRAVELMIPVLRALAFAHERGIIHRDLKPSNIFWTDTGVVKVLDFGLAKAIGGKEMLLDPRTPAFDEASALREEIMHTSASTQMGTLPYMSPEQRRGEPLDARSDVWAAALVLAELVLGRHLLAPFTIASLWNVPQIDVPMPSLRELRPDLGKLGSVIDRCLLKRLEDRLGSARAFLAELESISPGRVRAAANDELNPFAGLAAFQSADAARFFGRSAAVAHVVARLAEQPLLAIVGPSGAGKSSFVRAGVIPALERAEAWQSFTMRPGSRPLAALADLLLNDAGQTSNHGRVPNVARAPLPTLDREVLAQTLHAEPGLLGTRLREVARRRLKRVMLFVDQAEELYTLTSEPERRAFLACLGGAADDAGSPLRVVLSIRSDFLDRLADAGSLVTTLHQGILLLPPMDREELREALVKPLDAVEHRFEPPTLVDEMIDALALAKGALPLLSFTAARLWDGRDRRQRALTEANYRHLGGIAGALSGHADAVLGAMSTEERALARAALLRLVTPERTRAVVPIRELHEFGPRPGDMDRVLGRLIDARLLSVEGSGQAEARVEIVHESLITGWPTLVGWLSDNQEDAAFLSRLRDAARAWEAGALSLDLLWRGEVLESARLWRTRFSGHLAQGEERFLQASIHLTERGRQIRRRLVAGALGALSVIVVLVSFLALSARRSAARAMAEQIEAQAQRAEAERSAVSARNATRMAAARERLADPTTVLALLREVEPPNLPPGWDALARWALDAGVAGVILRHPGAVTSAAWSPDGLRIVTTSEDTTVRVWNADGSGLTLVLRGHEARVLSATWSPDGKHLVTASSDKTARVWNADGSGQPLVLRGHEMGLWSAAWSPDGRCIVTASSDKTARVWNADGGGQPLILRGHAAGIFSAAWSPDGRRIVTASEDKTVRVWNADGAGRPLVLRGHMAEVNSATWSPSGTRIVTASADKTVRIWNADGSGRPLVLRGHEDSVNTAAWSPDGLRIVTTSFDKTARVWNVDRSGQPLLLLRGHEDHVQSAEWSPDGKRIVTASYDKTARVWNIDRSGQTVVLRGHDQVVNSAAWSPDRTRIVTASEDMTARVWNADGRGQPLVLRGHDAAVSHAEWSPDGTRIVTASSDKTARIRSIGAGPLVVMRGHEAPVLWAAWSPDSRRIVTASTDKTARVWNADGSGKPLVLRNDESAVYSAAWSPDGLRIVTASADKTARIWNADGSGKPLVLRGHQALVWSAAWNPDGRRIVTASEDKTARVWNADGSGEPIILRGHEHWVNSAGFSPDGQRIFTSSQDKTVRVWNADGSGEPLILRGATAGYNIAAWSPDGKRIAAPSDDGTVWVWSELSPLQGPSDPKLWAATNNCLPAEDRLRVLGIPEDAAKADEQACLRRVEAARAAPR